MVNEEDEVTVSEDEELVGCRKDMVCEAWWLASVAAVFRVSVCRKPDLCPIGKGCSRWLLFIDEVQT